MQWLTGKNWYSAGRCSGGRVKLVTVTVFLVNGATASAFVVLTQEKTSKTLKGVTIIENY